MEPNHDVALDRAGMTPFRGIILLAAGPASERRRSASCLDWGFTVETPAPSARKPSLFIGGLLGYLATALVGAVVYWIVATRSGDFDNQRAGRLLIGFGAAGALAGYEFTAWRRKRQGANEPSDEWRQFFGSRAFYLLAGVVIAGSFAIS
jgi:hypothetical protein